jgi:hypothetical protein
MMQGESPHLSDWIEGSNLKGFSALLSLRV